MTLNSSDRFILILLGKVESILKLEVMASLLLVVIISVTPNSA